MFDWKAATIAATRALTRAAAISLLAGLISVAGGPSATAKDLLIKDGQIIDPATRQVRQENLLIREGKIIVTFQGIPDGLDAEIVDASGKWVIPGLIDMHVHSYGNQGPNRTFDAPGPDGIAKRALYVGVTGFLDLFGDEETLVSLRDQQISGDLGGADIYASLSCLTAPDGHCTEYGVPTRTMTTPAEATATVASLAERHPDVIKIVYQPTDDQPSIDKPTLKAAVAEAKKHDLKTIVHIKTWQDVRDVIEAGASAVTHVPYGAMPADIPALMAASNVAIIPTLAMHTDLAAYLFDEAVLNQPFAKAAAAPKLIEAYRDPAVQDRYAERKAAWTERKVKMLADVKAMADAGVLVLAGTDAGNWGTIHGYSLHRELIILREAGLDAWEVLAAATTKAGAFLEEDLGVSPGDRASLVILNANPLEDMAATQKLEAVIHHGELIDRSALLASTD